MGDALGARYFQADDAGLVPWLESRAEANLFCLMAERDRAILPTLQQACRAHHIALHGAIFPALINQQGVEPSGIWLCPEPRAQHRLVVFDRAQGFEGQVRLLEEAIHALLAHWPDAAHRPCLRLIFDGQLPRVGSLLDRLYLTFADRVRYVGACAGSETFAPIDCLFDTTSAMGNGVVCSVLPAQNCQALPHGYRISDRQMLLTSHTGNCINQIDWRPAFEVYQSLAEQLCDSPISAETFYQVAVHMPFGVLRLDQEPVVRIPVQLDANGAIHCAGEVPDHAILTLLEGPPANLELAKSLHMSSLPAATELALFYCAGRYQHLGDAANAELQALWRESGVQQLYGALSLGEIGERSAGQVPLFHNGAITCFTMNHQQERA